MASIPSDLPQLHIREQLVRIDKLQSEIQKTQADLAKVQLEVRFTPRTLLIQSTIAAAALLGAGAALAKLL